MSLILGDAENNLLNGTPDADEIYGLLGNDTLIGNSGNDSLNGNEGDDIINGSSEADTVRGGKGNDQINGDANNDILYGDRGANTLTGGANQDIFVISRFDDSSETDTITDFSDGEDFIGLEGLNFNELTLVADGNNTVIQDNLTGNNLAILSGINPSQITAADFTNTLVSFGGTTLVNGLASGDTTQDSTVLWTRSLVLGEVTFEYSTDANFNNIIATETVTVTDTNVPVKATLTDLTPSTQYYYRVTDAVGEQATGQFLTANPLGTREGLRFGVSGDLQGALAPFVSISNADEQDLAFFVQMGDMMEADSESAALPGVTQASTLDEFRIKQSEIYSQRFGLNPWADLRASTSVYGTWDDHELPTTLQVGQLPQTLPREMIFLAMLRQDLSTILLYLKPASKPSRTTSRCKMSFMEKQEIPAPPMSSNCTDTTRLVAMQPFMSWMCVPFEMPPYPLSPKQPLKRRLTNYSRMPLNPDEPC